jgi:acetylornithine deacetylase/succinyl-diaminopimelate desuccinylase-like protein
MKHSVDQLDKSLDWHWLPAQTQYVIDQAIAIQQIPAPTFNEGVRARYVAEQFKTIGLTEIQIDDMFNVYGLLPGTQKPGLMISAHTDTVFEQSTDLQIRRKWFDLWLARATTWVPGWGWRTSCKA